MMGTGPGRTAWWCRGRPGPRGTRGVWSRRPSRRTRLCPCPRGCASCWSVRSCRGCPSWSQVGVSFWGRLQCSRGYTTGNMNWGHREEGRTRQAYYSLVPSSEGSRWVGLEEGSAAMVFLACWWFRLDGSVGRCICGYARQLWQG